MTSEPNISPMPWKGQRLGGRYRLGGVLGSGGFATVFEGYDEMIERPVAVKILSRIHPVLDPNLRDSALARFKKESRLAALIRHPNVITIFDVGVTEAHGLPFIVMELLDGHTFKEELERSGPMAPERLLPLVCKVLDGLSVGHDLGIVHKDLKPANLFIIDPGGPREDVRVVDFGIARFEEESEALTGSGKVAGTPQYLAPEYIADKTISAGLDIYQVGLIVSEMLSGQRAVNGPHLMSCMLKHTHGQIDIPKALLSSPLGPILRKATALAPTERYSSANEMRRALMALDPTTVPVGSKRTLLSEPADSSEECQDSGTLKPFDIGLSETMEAPSGSRPVTLLPDEMRDTGEPEHTQGPPIPPTSERRGWGVGAGVVVLALSLVAGIWWFQSDPTPVSSSPSAAEPTAAPPDQDVVIEEAQALAQEPESTPEEVPSTPKVEAISVAIHTTPCRTAQLYEGRERLGQTPFTLTFDGPGTPERQLAVHCKNYASRIIKVSPTSGERVVIQLKPAIRLPK